MEFKHQMIGSTLLYKYHDPVFNDVGIINFKRNLAILIDKYPVKDIILDVENTKIIDNNGLSAIMFARRFTEANGQNCVLGMPRPKLLNLLKTSKLTPSFKIIQRKEEYQTYLKTLVEKADKERAEREAEKAKRAEEAKKLRSQETSKEVPREEKDKKQAQIGKVNTPRKPKKRIIKKKEV